MARQKKRCWELSGHRFVTMVPISRLFAVSWSENELVLLALKRFEMLYIMIHLCTTAYTNKTCNDNITTTNTHEEKKQHHSRRQQQPQLTRTTLTCLQQQAREGKKETHFTATTANSSSAAANILLFLCLFCCFDLYNNNNFKVFFLPMWNKNKIHVSKTSTVFHAANWPKSNQYLHLALWNRQFLLEQMMVILQQSFAIFRQISISKILYKNYGLVTVHVRDTSSHRVIWKRHYPWQEFHM